MHSTTTPFDLAVNPGVWMTGWDLTRMPAVLAPLAPLGYRRVVVVLRDPWTFDTTGIADTVGGAGLEPLTNTNQTPTEDVSSDDPAVRDAGIARLRRAIELSVELGSDALTGVNFGVLGKASAPVSAQAFDRTAKVMGQLADEAAAVGVRLVVEVVNRYETNLFNTARRAMEFTDASGSQALGIHLDVFHMNIEEDDMVAAVELALPRLAYLEIEQNHRGELTRGHVDLDAFLDGVLAAGYRGRYGLEAFSANAIADFHAAGLAVWRDQFGPDTRIAAEATELLTAAYARAGIDAQDTQRKDTP